MFRQFWSYLINEGFTVARLWPSLFDDFASGGAAIDGFALASAKTESAPSESAPRGQTASVVPELIFAPADTDILILAPAALLTAAADRPSVPDPIMAILPPFDSPAADGSAAGLATADDRFQIVFSDVLSPGATIDMQTSQLTGGDEGPTMSGASDSLILSGDFSGAPTLPGADSAVVLPASLPGLDSIIVQAGADYRLAVTDGNVADGDLLNVNAMPLGPGEHIEFDGSAELGGRFAFYGSEGDDRFEGGGGDDRMHGLGGADSLTGGGGADLFAYTGAAESSGDSHDTLVDFDSGEDRIDLLGTVTGFGDAVEGGTLSTASFDADLGTALGTDGLGAGEAVLFAPDAGDLAGTLFLIVDANGEAGYQAGEDYVFALPNADLAALDGHTAIFV